MATASLLGALLGAAHVARAADPVDCRVTRAGKIEIASVASPQACSRIGGKLVHPVYCELKRTSKRETKKVASAQDCSRLDGKVVRKAKHPRGSRSQRRID